MTSRRRASTSAPRRSPSTRGSAASRGLRAIWRHGRGQDRHRHPARVRLHRRASARRSHRTAPNQIGVGAPDARALAAPLLGTDDLGRDVSAASSIGGRSVIVHPAPRARCSPSWSAASRAMLAGYLGGRIDAIIGRVTDVLLSLPYLLVVLVIVAAARPSTAGAGARGRRSSTRRASRACCAAPPVRSRCASTSTRRRRAASDAWRSSSASCCRTSCRRSRRVRGAPHLRDHLRRDAQLPRPRPAAAVVELGRDGLRVASTITTAPLRRWRPRSRSARSRVGVGLIADAITQSVGAHRAGTTSSGERRAVLDVADLTVAYRRNRQPDAIVVARRGARARGRAASSASPASPAAASRPPRSRRSASAPRTACALGGRAMLGRASTCSRSRARELRRSGARAVAYVGAGRHAGAQPAARARPRSPSRCACTSGSTRRGCARRALELLVAASASPTPRRALRRYPHQFSGGQQQRIALAIAMACEPAGARARRADHRARRHDPGADHRADPRASSARRGTAALYDQPRPRAARDGLRRRSRSCTPARSSRRARAARSTTRRDTRTRRR